MIKRDENPTLREIIHHALHSEHPGNRFSYDQRSKEEERLMTGISNKNSKAGKGAMGIIDLDQTLSDILDDKEGFLEDINYFLAGSRQGKYQYAMRFETLLNYLNHHFQASILTDFLSKYLTEDDSQRRLKLLMGMHPGINKSRKSIAQIADEFGVDVKTIREDFNRLAQDFSFLGSEIKIKGFYEDNNSPVHPVFLALNSTQIYGLLYALKVLASGTVVDEVSQEIATSVYSQLSQFGKDLVSDVFPPEEMPGYHKNMHIGSDLFLREQNKKVVLHAAAYKKTCTITYLDGDEEKTVTGIPKILRDVDHNTYSLDTGSARKIEIHVDKILRAYEGL